tara:strand:- start:658 stop:951 length:294 start_codon:yes stop_codon:yes gene_type:complete
MREVDYNRLNIDDKINILLNDHANCKFMKPIHVIALIEKFNSLRRQSKSNQIYIEHLENRCEVYKRMLYVVKQPEEVTDAEFEQILQELLLEKEVKQ